MDEKNYKAAVRVLAGHRQAGGTAMEREELRNAVGIEAPECEQIIGRLLELKHLQMVHVANAPLAISASIIEYDQTLNKPPDLVAKTHSLLNSKWWFAYPAMIFAVLLALAGILAAPDIKLWR